jgi:hypothetical protein
VSRIEAEISSRFRRSVVTVWISAKEITKRLRPEPEKTRFGHSRLAAKPFAAQAVNITV